MKLVLFSNETKLFLNHEDGFGDLSSASEIDPSEFGSRYKFGGVEMWEVPEVLAMKLQEIWGDYPEDLDEADTKGHQMWQDSYVSHNFPEFYAANL